MTSKLRLLVMLACGFWMSVAAAEDPANSKLLKQCESAKGKVKRECEAVAKKMIKKQPAADEREDTTDQDITHSSPAMTTPTEAKKEERAKQKPPG
ncbi:hypothetical protein [Steroidobacter agaridevorans]|nr:hypothetical protein [Steroidobacter agaridevorans]